MLIAGGTSVCGQMRRKRRISFITIVWKATQSARSATPGAVRADCVSRVRASA
jgi:hypothetical protein